MLASWLTAGGISQITRTTEALIVYSPDEVRSPSHWFIHSRYQLHVVLHLIRQEKVVQM